MPELSELFDLIAFDARSHSVAEAGLELRTILLPQPPNAAMTASKPGPAGGKPENNSVLASFLLL